MLSRWLIKNLRFRDILKYYCNFIINTASIRELLESEQTPSKICNLSQGSVSRVSVYKALKYLKATDTVLLKVKSTQNRKVRTSKLTKNPREKTRRNLERNIRKERPQPLV